MKQLSICTDRLKLRPFVLDDFDEVHAYASDPLVTRFTDWGPNSPEETREFIRAAVAALDEPTLRCVLLALEFGESGRVIGTVGIERTTSELGDASLGFCLHRDFWGRGLATEAAQALLSWSASALGLRRVYATCRPDNRASARVLEKLGMRREGRLRQNVCIDGQWRDSLVYATTLGDSAAGLLPPLEYLESLPRKRMAAGVLFFDGGGRILIVKPTYKEGWEVPGGVVEAGESPRRAAVRETAEELGVVIDEQRVSLACVDYLHPNSTRTEGLIFLFAGGVLDADRVAEIDLPDAEISAYRFAPLDEAVELLGGVRGPRVARCVQAIEDGRACYFEHRASD